MNCNRVVVKIGSSSLTYENGKINLNRLERLVRVCSDIKNSGKEVVLVTSGAIAIGVSKLNLPQKPVQTRQKQACAAVGQCRLMSIYDKLFSEYGHNIAQMLLTGDIMQYELWINNVKNTFESLLEYGVIPIVNENDSINFEEIEFGDNDRLSALVATLINADRLIILTDIDGYFSKDPRANKDAHLINEVNLITEEMIQSAGGAGSNKGTGGMKSKLIAAKTAMQSGIVTHILNGDDPYIIRSALEGETVGTVFR